MNQTTAPQWAQWIIDAADEIRDLIECRGGSGPMHDSEEAIIARHAAAAGRQDAVQGLVDACESLIDAASRMDKPFAPALLDSAARDATKAFLAYRSLPPQDAALTAEREKLLRRAVTAIADVCDGGSLWQLGAVLADAARMGITEGTKCSTTSGS